MVTTTEAIRPEVKVLETTQTYGKFAVEPLERGFALTLGNPLRRVLLSGIPGTAVTWIKIDGVLHEYTTIPHLREDVQEFILNVKAIRLRSHTDRPGKMRLEVEGQREVYAQDIMVPPDYEIVNPDLYLASLDSPDARLSVEFNIEHDKGYRPASQADGLPIGVLPVDAIFSPVRKVNYSVERTRVGQVTDYERLIVEVWTDNTISPTEAIQQAASILVDHFFLLANTGTAAQGTTERRALALAIPAEQYNMPVEKLGLSSRTLNSLKRAGLHKVGDILEMSKSDLLKTRNFGEKSYQELYGRLRDLGLAPAESEPSQDGSQEAQQPEPEAQEQHQPEALEEQEQ